MSRDVSRDVGVFRCSSTYFRKYPCTRWYKITTSDTWPPNVWNLLSEYVNLRPNIMKSNKLTIFMFNIWIHASRYIHVGRNIGIGVSLLFFLQ